MIAVRLALTAIVAATLAGRAVADVALPIPESYETAGRLAEDCAKPQFSAGAQYCLGYVVAIADTLPANGLVGHGACGPRGIVSMQLVTAVLDWLGRHAEFRDRPAAPVVANALTDQFPCRH